MFRIYKSETAGTGVASIVYKRNIHNEYTNSGYVDIGFTRAYLYLSGLNLGFVDNPDNLPSPRGIISCCGSVNGLAYINNIPSDGWGDWTAVLPGYGYVGEVDGTYIRIYVIDYVKSAEGNIIGAIFKYQYPFVP